MSEMVKARRNSNFTPEEIERGLHTLASLHGNSRRAQELLREGGMSVDQTTLRRWSRDQYPERYRTIVREQMPEVYDRIASKNEEMVGRVLEIEDQVLTHLDGKMGEIELKDLPKTLHYLGVSKGIAQDKARVIRGEPTEIRETRDLTQLLTQLQRKFPGVLNVNPDLIEGTAEEVAP